MSAGHKQAWYDFVQAKTGDTKYDPSRHDEGMLMEFTKMADAGQIEVGTGTGGGMTFDMNTGKQALVMQVKTWQKTSASHKEAWYNFVQEKTGETSFDPNRHDEALLSEFINMTETGQIELKDPTGFGSSGPKKGKGGGGGGGS